MGQYWFTRDWGVITVEVIGARDLINFDVDGSEGDLTDSFMEVSLMDSLGREGVQRTRVVEDDLAPEYHESFTFHLTGPICRDSELRVTCFDSDNFLDEFMGEVRIRLWKLRRYIVVDDWFPLTNADEREIGQVRLCLQYIPPPEEVDSVPAPPPAGGSSPQ